MIAGDIPRISAKSDKNGIIGSFDTLNLKSARHFENFISVNFFGTDGGIFYHPYQASVEMKVHTLKMYNKEFNSKTGQFIVSALTLALHGFGYGNQLSSSKLKDLDFKIQLPIKNGEINFSFMEKFIAELEAERIAELEAERIAELEAYLIATNLKDYTLTKKEEKVLNDFGKMNWGTFKISEVFKKLNLKNHNKSFDKLRDTSTTKTTEFNLPLVNAKLGNNGIMFYGREKDFDSSEMTIDIISNGAVATGTVYAQTQKTGVLWDAYLLKSISEDMTKQKLLYMATSLQKAIKTKFGWDNKAVWSKVQHETISLPINNNKLDYQIMETFISAIQKLVIKDVVIYADKKIATSKEVVNGK